jgi:hypothetical protein
MLLPVRKNNELRIFVPEQGDKQTIAMESVSLYSEARNEYLKQLSTWIVPPTVEFFRNEYSTIAAREGNRRAMAVFQEFCSVVPKWNQDVIETNVHVLLENCRCDYIEELMTAVFIAHTKMLTAIRVNSKQKKLQITLPKLDHFIHRIFIECARAFWKAPFLLSEELPPIERQKNILQLESIATEALSSAVRSLLPVKTILRDYMNDDDSSSEEEAAARPPAKTKSKQTAAAPQPQPDSDSSDDEDNTAILEEIQSDMANVALTEAVAAALPVAAAPVAAAPVAAAPVAAAPVAAAPVAAAPVAAAPVAAAPVAVAAAPIIDDDDNAPIDIQKHTPVSIQKLDTPPEIQKVTESQHSVHAELKPTGILLQKDPELPTVAAADTPIPPNPNPPNLLIETEPSVHFTPYDTVFDENRSDISEIRYTPKVSVEDKPPSNWGMSFDDDEDDIPKLSISNTASILGADEIVDLDAPPAGPAAATAAPPVDVDEALTIGGDFEELA